VKKGRKKKKTNHAPASEQQNLRRQELPKPGKGEKDVFTKSEENRVRRKTGNRISLTQKGDILYCGVLLPEICD